MCVYVGVRMRVFKETSSNVKKKSKQDQHKCNHNNYGG